ncbi:MAG: PTS sugar transporter subunit IIA, partial [Chloroflexi bacterium]|nr:PTS sugar transporter subunit IIA [Chloroflexota bacterium]
MSGLRDVELRSLAGGSRSDGASLAVALEPANVLLDLPLSGSADCMRQMVDSLHLPTDVDRSRVLDGLLTRERLCSTVLGHGFAVPHTARNGARLVKEHTVAFVRARRAIPVAPDGVELTDLFLLVFAADELAHLQLLARATSLARSLALSQALRAASDAEEVIRLLHNEEQRAFGS